MSEFDDYGRYLPGKAVTIAPVALVVTTDGGTRNAMTASSFSEVAHHPTSLWLSVRPQTLTHELILATRRFTLASLHVGQAALAIACGTVSGRSADKTANLGLYEVNGYWHVPDAYSSIACEVIGEPRTVGDHVLFIGEISEAFADSHNPIRRQLLTSDLRGQV